MKLLRKIGPLLLLPLMLLSSIGFSLEIHFCGGEVKSIGLFSAKPCEMENGKYQTLDVSDLPPCHQKKLKNSPSPTDKNGLNKGKCCHNESLIFETNSELQSNSKIITNASQVNAIIIYSIINYSLIQLDIQPVFYKNYKPPLINQDLSIIHQVFRI